MPQLTDEEKQLLEMMQKSRVGPAMDNLAELFEGWVAAGRPRDIGEFQRNYKPEAPRESAWKEWLRNLPMVFKTIGICLLVMFLFWKLIEYVNA